MRRGYRGRANNNRAGRFSRQRYQPYPPYHPHNAPPVYIPPPIAPYHPPQPVPTSVPIRKQEPRDQLTATLKMYCDDDVIERVLNNNTVNGPPPTHEYQPDLAISEAEQLTRNAIDDARVPASPAPNTLAIDTSHVTSRAVPSVTPVNSVTAPPTQTPPSAVKVSISRPIGHVPVVAPKKAIARPSQRPVTAPVVNMTPQQKEIQLKLAPVQSVSYEGGKSLKFPYDPIEWPKTPKQYVLEWFQRQSSLRVNKQLALIDPQRAAAMSQVPKWEKVSAPALRQGLHLVTLHVTDPRTLQALTFTPDRYWSTVKEAEHVASLMFLQYLLPQANSAKEIHEAMENMQRHQKRLKSTGPVPRKPGAVPAERVGHEVYSAVPPTPQLTVSTRAHDAAPVKQFIDTRHPASVAPKPVPNAPQPSHLPYSNYNHNNINPAVAGYFNPMYMGYYYHYGQHPSYNYPYPPQ